MTLSKENFKEHIQKLKNELKVDRDELKLQLHLAKSELKDQWETTEVKWRHFKSKSKVINDSVGEAGHDLAAGLRELGKEIKHAYKDIKRGIKSSKLTK